MKLSTICLSITLLLIPSMASAVSLPIYEESPHTKLALDYAQSDDVWKILNQTQSSNLTLDSVNELLNKKFSTFEEIFGKINFGIYDIPSKSNFALLKGFYFEFGLEGIGTGWVQNPVLPELHLDVLATTLLRAGITGSLADLGTDKIKTSIGFVGGLGYEYAIDATSASVLNSAPIRTGRLLFAGFDTTVFYQSPAVNDWVLNTSLANHLASYSSVAGVENENEAILNSMWIDQWKGKIQVLRNFTLPVFSQSAAGIDFISGPQPIPVDILPQTWGYIHQVTPFPDIRSMLGFGFALKLGISPFASVDTSFGYYGGYWGGGITYHNHTIALNMENWGLERTSFFQNSGQQIWRGSFSVLF